MVSLFLMPPFCSSSASLDRLTPWQSTLHRRVRPFRPQLPAMSLRLSSMPVLLQQHQGEHERLVPGMPSTLR